TFGQRGRGATLLALEGHRLASPAARCLAVEQFRQLMLDGPVLRRRGGVGGDGLLVAAVIALHLVAAGREEQGGAATRAGEAADVRTGFNRGGSRGNFRHVYEFLAILAVSWRM